MNRALQGREIETDQNLKLEAEQQFAMCTYKDRLYEDIAVRLVDDGAHDNQGVMGLLEQDCTVIVISDASGQMETQDNLPSRGLIGVPAW